jgi:hypothetical protein
VLCHGLRREGVVLDIPFNIVEFSPLIGECLEESRTSRSGTPKDNCVARKLELQLSKGEKCHTKHLSWPNSPTEPGQNIAHRWMSLGLNDTNDRSRVEEGGEGVLIVGR